MADETRNPNPESRIVPSPERFNRWWEREDRLVDATAAALAAEAKMTPETRAFAQTLKLERGGDAWETAVEVGRDLERMEQARRHTNRAAFWCFVGFVMGGLLVGAAVFEYCARAMETMVR